MVRNFILAISLISAGLFQSPAYAGSGENAPPAASPLPPETLNALMNWAPMLLLVAVWVFMMRRSNAAKAQAPQTDPAQVLREVAQTSRESVSVLKEILEELKRR